MTEVRVGYIAQLHDLLAQLTRILDKIAADQSAGKQANSAPRGLEDDLMIAAAAVVGAIGRFEETGDAKKRYLKSHDQAPQPLTGSPEGVEMARQRYLTQHKQRR